MRTAIKVGQTITLNHDDNESGHWLRSIPDPDAAKSMFLSGHKVKVLAISMNRREMRGNSVLIQVQHPNDELVKGWIIFDLGLSKEGYRVRVQALYLEPPASKVLPKAEVKCDG